VQSAVINENRSRVTSPTRGGRSVGIVRLLRSFWISPQLCLMCTYTLIASNARALFTALCMYNPSRLGIQVRVRLMQCLVLCLSVMTLIHFSHRAELLLLRWYVVSMFFFFLGWSET
jgi:hypothetical protein